MPGTVIGYRAATVAAVVAILALALGIAGLSVGLVRATRAEAEARQEAETAKQISDFMTELFKAPRGNRSLGKTITAREILDKGAARIENELACRRCSRSAGLWRYNAVLSRCGFCSTWT